jgi:hypothetical protein
MVSIVAMGVQMSREGMHRSRSLRVIEPKLALARVQPGIVRRSRLLEARALFVGERIALSVDSVELLVARTAGWPAGLYLWLRGLEEPDRAARTFVGSSRKIAGYLTDEVLRALAPETRGLLLRTSVLGRSTPELCDAVLSRKDSAAVLAGFARANMFLVAAGDAETVAELLVENHRELASGDGSRSCLAGCAGIPQSCCPSTLRYPLSGRLPGRCSRTRRSRLSGCLRSRSAPTGSGRNCGRRISRWSLRSRTRCLIERADVGAVVRHARPAVALPKRAACSIAWITRVIVH